MFVHLRPFPPPSCSSPHGRSKGWGWVGKRKRAVRQNNSKERGNLLSRWGGDEEDGVGGTAFKLDGGKEKTGEECENVDFFSSLPPSHASRFCLQRLPGEGGQLISPPLKRLYFEARRKGGRKQPPLQKCKSCMGMAVASTNFRSARKIAPPSCTHKIRAEECLRKPRFLDFLLLEARLGGGHR